MSILQDLQRAKNEFDSNALDLISTAINNDNINEVLSKLDELVSIITTARSIGVISRDTDKQVSDYITMRLNESIDVLTGAVRPTSQIRKKEVIEHAEVVEREVLPVLTMKQKVKREWEEGGRRNLTDSKFISEEKVGRRNKWQKCSRSATTLPIGWRKAAVPQERYTAPTVLKTMRAAGVNSPVITYELTPAARRRDIPMWHLTTEEALVHVISTTGEYVGRLMYQEGNTVQIRPLWLNTTNQVTLSSAVLQLELIEEIRDVVL